MRVDRRFEFSLSAGPSAKIMKKFLLALTVVVLASGGLFACPQDDPPPPGGGEGTGKPTAPAKPKK